MNLTIGINIYSIHVFGGNNMVGTKDKLSITELSKLLNVTDHTLRYYEKEFNLQIPRDSRGRRYYNKFLYDVFLKIKQLRDEGMDIKSIREYLQNNATDENLFVTETVYEQNSPACVNPVSLSIDCIKTDIDEIKSLLSNLANKLPDDISSEINMSAEQIINELNNHSRKLSASIETSNKLIEAKLESHLEKHFNKIDESLSEWRRKSKEGTFKQFFQKIGLVSY